MQENNDTKDVDSKSLKSDWEENNKRLLKEQQEEEKQLKAELQENALREIDEFLARRQAKIAETKEANLQEEKEGGEESNSAQGEFALWEGFDEEIKAEKNAKSKNCQGDFDVIDRIVSELVSENSM